MSEKIEQYFENIDSLISEINETQKGVIKQSAELITESIKNDGVVQVFGTGHSTLLAQELFFRAGSLAPINFVLDVSVAGTVSKLKSSKMERVEGVGEILFEHARPEPNDVFIVISNSGRNAVPIELAQKASEEEFPVIVLTSTEYSLNQPSRHSSGKRLMDFGNVVIDNCGKVGDVSVKFPEMDQGVAATSTIAGSYILNAIVVQVTSNMLDEGMEPPIFKSGNLNGGMAFNEKLMDKYRDRIQNW